MRLRDTVRVRIAGAWTHLDPGVLTLALARQEVCARCYHAREEHDRGPCHLVEEIGDDAYPCLCPGFVASEGREEGAMDRVTAWSENGGQIICQDCAEDAREGGAQLKQARVIPGRVCDYCGNAIGSEGINP